MIERWCSEEKPESSIRGRSPSWAGGEVGREPEKGGAPRAQERVGVMLAHGGPCIYKGKTPTLPSKWIEESHSDCFLSPPLLLTTDMSTDNILPLKPVAEAPLVLKH